MITSQHIETHIVTLNKIIDLHSEVEGLFDKIVGKSKYTPRNKCLLMLLADRSGALIAIAEAQKSVLIENHKTFNGGKFDNDHKELLLKFHNTCGVCRFRGIGYKGNNCVSSDNAFVIANCRGIGFLFKMDYINDCERELNNAIEQLNLILG